MVDKPRHLVSGAIADTGYHIAIGNMHLPIEYDADSGILTIYTAHAIQSMNLTRALNQMDISEDRVDTDPPASAFTFKDPRDVSTLRAFMQPARVRASSNQL